MFVFTKGKIKTFNPLKDRKNIRQGKPGKHIRQKDGSFKLRSPMERREFGQRFNIWDCGAERTVQEHPAPFPRRLIEDHITSWSNPGDLVLDPFGGSGTTAVAALRLGRRAILIEKEPTYVELAKRRIAAIDI
jgi:site-specific DNA-methyltransferase (adenine-specific)